MNRLHETKLIYSSSSDYFPEDRPCSVSLPPTGARFHPGCFRNRLRRLDPDSEESEGCKQSVLRESRYNPKTGYRHYHIYHPARASETSMALPKRIIKETERLLAEPYVIADMVLI